MQETTCDCHGRHDCSRNHHQRRHGEVVCVGGESQRRRMERGQDKERHGQKERMRVMDTPCQNHIRKHEGRSLTGTRLDGMSMAGSHVVMVRIQSLYIVVCIVYNHKWSVRRGQLPHNKDNAVVPCIVWLNGLCLHSWNRIEFLCRGVDIWIVCVL